MTDNEKLCDTGKNNNSAANDQSQTEEARIREALLEYAQEANEKAGEEVCFVSSYNLFADDGIPDAEGCLARAELLASICLEVKRRRLSKRRIRLLLGLSRRQVRQMLEMRIDEFSPESLVAMALKLGASVEDFPKTMEKEPKRVVVNLQQPMLGSAQASQSESSLLQKFLSFFSPKERVRVAFASF